jgi:5-methyltetrahydrofolate--homocysteine methyltransferase
MSLEIIYQNVIQGKAADVEAGVQAALASGVSAEEILNNALIAAMDDVGQRFEAGDFFVPEMLVAARAMQAGLNILKPHLAESGVQSAGTVAMGTVKGSCQKRSQCSRHVCIVDYHDGQHG